MPPTCRLGTAAGDEAVRTLPPPVAARTPGRTAGAVRQRRYVLDAADLRRPCWAEAEDQLLMRLPPEQAARYLRRTPAAIQARRRKLGLLVGS